jgi:hypothetical protein
MPANQIQVRRRGSLALAGAVVSLAALAVPSIALADVPPTTAAGSVDFGRVTLVEGGAAVTVPVTVTCSPATEAPVAIGLKIVQTDLNGGLASGSVTGSAGCGEPTTVTVYSTGALFKVGPASGQVYALPAGGPITRAKPFQITD